MKLGMSTLFALSTILGGSALSRGARSLSDEELDEITNNYKSLKESSNGSKRVDLTDEELAHVRSLSKKERKAYMKEKRNK